MIRILSKYGLNFLIFVLLQVFVLNNIQFSGFINPYLYIFFILTLPFETPGWLLIISGFFLGLTIDLFSNTPGIHAGATTFLAFIRPIIIRIISIREEFEPGSSPDLFNYGLLWYIKYAVILIFLHHLLLFYLEIFSFHDFLFTLLRVILSSIFTFVLVLLSGLFIHKR